MRIQFGRTTGAFAATLLLVITVSLVLTGGVRPLRLVCLSSTDPNWRWSEVTVYGLDTRQQLDTIWWHRFGFIPEVRVFPEGPGSERYRVVSGWIATRVTGLLSGAADSLVLIDPLSDRRIAEVGAIRPLLIDAGTILYRTGDSLCTAILSDNAFGNRRLVLKDPRVQDVY